MSISRSLVGAVADAVLTTEPKQRLRISRSLLAAALYTAIFASTESAVLLGLIEQQFLRPLLPALAVGPIVFYLLIRSGWNLRCQDPALTLAQMVYAVSALMAGYAFTGSFRAVLLLIVTQIMGFGMFSLTPADARRLTAFAIVGFSTTMIGLAVFLPTRFDPRLEIIHLLMLDVVLLVIGTVSQQFWRLRMRLREQRATLRETLERLETLVRHDALTGLVNRRCMGELLEAERLRRLAQPAPACLCAIDLDHFKRVNDSFGHAAGDAVLQRFASAALGCLRSVDALARWGGEEFLLLLPGTDAGQASALLGRLRDALAAPAVWQDEPQWAVTFSAGVTDWGPGESAEAAIERADAAAYQAKARGRDTWCVG